MVTRLIEYLGKINTKTKMRIGLMKPCLGLGIWRKSKVSVKSWEGKKNEGRVKNVL